MPTVKVTKPTDVTFDAIRLVVAVRYEEEDIPNDFPGRTGDTWDVTIELDPVAKIRGWKGPAFSMHMKVCDEGSYYLLNGGNVVGSVEQDYVPGCFPGPHYGDYLKLEVTEDGTITNWRKNPDYQSFYPRED